MADDLVIKPVTPELWPAFERLFGANGACAGCWCMWWRLPRSAFKAGQGAGNRAAFRERVTEAPPPGLLAFAENAPIGWCQVCPRAELPTLDRSRNLAAVDERPVWSLSCFFIKAGHRRKGVSRALIRAAVAFAREQGAPALEAYPWDSETKQQSSTVFTGLASSFHAAGFREVARRAAHRPILRYELAP